MRKKNILTAVMIAVVAGGFGYGLNAFLQDNTQSTDVVETVAVVDAQDTTETAEATASAETSAQEVAQEVAMTEVDLNDVTLNEEVPAAGEEAATSEVPVDDTTNTQHEEATEASKKLDDAAANVKIDVAAALKDRSLGSASAPLTIYDYSSLTCPHCATFHNTIFPALKEQLIDTGKARWVFVGFPLNEPSLKAEMVARCAPEDQYDKLIDLMFKSQSKWAFENDPLAMLSLIVKSAGISEAQFLACVNNEELQRGMIEKARQAVEKHGIASTPTFIFNDGAKKISGVGSVEGFIYDAERFIKENAQSTPAASNTAE